MPIQYGICLFNKNSINGNILAKPYNFYIYPFSKDFKYSNITDKRFLCQTSALAFLKSNSFDFNKWLIDGKLLLLFIIIL